MDKQEESTYSYEDQWMLPSKISPKIFKRKHLNTIKKAKIKMKQTKISNTLE